ncbi:nucleoside triphosphate pyrophosphohydrolase family protein [Ferrimonas marina]|uniref:hypothetical protein n=1 Tax=Ferrimonas marina TaxID=299255 RepID=UPI0011612CD5|nr:hypothetical protein [Ferrimonas marina]
MSKLGSNQVIHSAMGTLGALIPILYQHLDHAKPAADPSAAIAEAELAMEQLKALAGPEAVQKQLERRMAALNSKLGQMAEVEGVHLAAIHLWGAERQIIKTMGDAGGLIYALNRYQNQQSGTLSMVINALVECQVMCTRLHYLFDDQAIRLHKEKGLQRLRQTL